MNIIKAVNLVFDYIRRDEEGQVEEVKRALDHVNLEIEKGSFVAILGHNGSGKSTFAKQINGILSPTDGTLFVSEMDTRDEAHLWDIRKNAGMVFQNPDNQIIGNIVEEDVGFGPENIGVPTEEIWKRVDESLKAVGMMMYRKQSPNHLSGGQKRRVAIAGVLAMNPEVLILDEPTAGLDPKGRDEILAAIHKLHEERGITVILVSHSMEDVARLVDRIIVMHKGKVAMTGTPREIFSHPMELEQMGLAAPQVSYVFAKLKEKGYDVPTDIYTVEEARDALLKLVKQVKA